MNSRARETHHAMAAVAKTTQGKGSARALRRQGFVPGVIYAAGHDSQTIGVNAKDLDKALSIGHFYTHTQELSLDGKAVKVLARDIQRDPLTDKPIHIDFMRFDPARVISVDVTVVITGQETSPGLKSGGVLQLIETTIEVECRADSIPQEIAIDVGSLDIGDSVHLSEVKLPKGVEAAVTDRDLTIVSVVSTRTSNTAADEAADAAAAAPAEVPATAQKGDAKGDEAKK